MQWMRRKTLSTTHTPALSRDRPRSSQAEYHAVQKAHLHQYLSEESISLSLCRSFSQCLRSCVMHRSGRRQCVCSIISPFVQGGCDLPDDVNFCRVPCDLHEVDLSRGQSHLRHKRIPQIRVVFFIQLSHTSQETCCNTHDLLAIRPDLKVAVLHSYRGDCHVAK